MLTRLKVTGFKNLVDIDIRFGPFTCIAGANGSGKSNLFDAIRFLGALADKPLLESVLAVRDDVGRSGDVRGIFTRVGEDILPKMTFEAEMIIPKTGTDDLGQSAEASITFVRYELRLKYRGESENPIEILHEALNPIAIRTAPQYILFPHSAGTWRKEAIQGRRTTPFLSTEDGKVKIHQEGSAGRTSLRSAERLPRTVLSSLNASENPTAFLTRKEMRSWQMLQLEPSALRKPDEFRAPRHLSTDGTHLPATLVRIAHESGDPDQFYCRVANRLAELLGGVKDITIDKDEKRELYTLLLTDFSRTTHPARALSEGTLRFIALITLLYDPKITGVLCLEEPENGIHPARIPAMLRLLQDIAVDTEEPLDEGNPLRQVIVNTHSPTLVCHLRPDDLIGVVLMEDVINENKRFFAEFLPLKSTWRSVNSIKTLSLYNLISYLSSNFETISIRNGEPLLKVGNLFSEDLN